jgi:hypothetical protein
VIALLAILGVGLAVGKLSGRITPSLELLLLLAVTAIVLLQLLVWKVGVDVDVSTLVRGATPGTR